MNNYKKNHIVFGITGGIAVYKAADLCSLLRKNGFETRVVMTNHAEALISEKIFFTLSGNNVVTDLFKAQYSAIPEHVHLAEWADLLLVAPCTANFIGKYANGIADDALSTIAITHRKPVLLAPAMNTDMWNSPAFQRNFKTLQEWGVQFVGPETGLLACGTTGIGRMSEPNKILTKVQEILS